MRGEDASNVAVNLIPPQRRITSQILKHSSSRPLQSPDVQRSYAFARSSASSPLPRTPSCGQRCETSSLRRKMPPRTLVQADGVARFAQAPAARMRLGLPVSDRPSSPLLWVRRLPPLPRCRPRHVAANGLHLMPWVITGTCTAHSGVKKAQGRMSNSLTIFAQPTK